MPLSLRLKSLALTLAVCLLLLALDIWTPLKAIVDNMDRVARVVQFQFRGPRLPDPSLRVVGITQNAVSAFATAGILYPPFPRDIHAVALERLADAGAKTVVVDVLFSEEGSWSDAEDQAMRDAVLYCRGKGCEVVLAAAVDSSMGGAAKTLLEPSDTIMEAKPLLGMSNAEAKLSYKLDERVGESIDVEQGGSFYSQAVTAYKLYCERQGKDFAAALGRYTAGSPNSYRINFNGQFDALPPGIAYDYNVLWPELEIGNEQRIKDINALRDARDAGSLSDEQASELRRLLTLTAEEQATLARDFGGATVFLGSRNKLDNDYFDTPFGVMYGVDTNAQAYDTLVSGRPIVTAGQPYVIAWCILLALAAWGFSIMRPILRGTSLGLAAAAATVMANLLLFRVAGIEMASTLPLACYLLPFVASISYSGYSEEQAKRAIRTSFSRYVSSELVDQVLKNPALAQVGQGVKCEAVVQFSDIRNYSTISEHMDAHSVIEMLNIYFGEAAEVVRRHGGSVDKYLGDGMMASFGAIVPREQPAVDGIRAALETIQVLHHKVHPRLKELGYPPFKVGIGMHYGEGVSGNIGSAARFDPTFIGDTTNLASRVESTTKEYGWAILVTREMVEQAQQAGANFDFEHVGQQRVKGRSTPVDLYRVLDPGEPEIYKL